MTIIKLLFIAALFAVGIMFFTLYNNGANLTQPPGFKERLQIFLGSNSAKTASDHKLKELRTPQFNLSADELYKRVLKAAADLGWKILSHDSENLNANFVVFSRLFLFEDDVYVQVQSIDQQRSALHVESFSRKGGADFAANSGHIQALINKL